jgi:hypothetical protein
VANPGNRNGAALVYGFDGNNGLMQVENTTFEGNSNAYSDGGSAFYGNGSSSSTARFTNCTFYNNSSNSGAFYAYNGKFTVVNSTFSGNIDTSSSYGSAFYARDNAAVQFALVNNILAYNYGGKAALFVGNKAEESGSNNLIESNAGKSILALQNTLSYNTNQDLFANYTTMNGKVVPQIDPATHTLSASSTSVAARAGVTSYADVIIPVLDQRGKQRGNPPYLGSYEYVDNLTLINSPTAKTEHFITINPATDRLQIRNVESLRSVTIIDLAGKTVQTNVHLLTDISLQNILGGYYIVRFETENRMLYEKLIIQK